MFTQNLLNLIVTTTILTTVSHAAEANSKILTLITKVHNAGHKDNETWDGKTCISLLKPERKLIRYQFEEDCNDCCANFYTTFYCNKKDFREYLTVTRKDSFFTNSNKTFPFWGRDSSFLNRVQSIGPSDTQCRQYPNDTIVSSDKTLIVTVYKNINLKGLNETLEVQECTVISKFLRRQISSLNSKIGICLELHEHWNCTGSFIQIRGLSTVQDSLNALEKWNFDDKASAISKCNYRNMRNNASQSNIKFIQPHEDVVTLYSQPGFKGKHKHLDLSQGCLNLTENWESIQTYDLCVKVYEGNGCDRSSPYFSLKQSEADLYSWNFETGIRSIANCDYASKYLEVGLSSNFSEESRSRITIYNQAGFKGDKINLKITKCIYPLWDSFHKKIESVKIEGHCVNLYNEPRCKGNDYIIVKTNISKLNDADGKYNYIQSIGPCYEQCHPYNIDQNIQKNVSVSIFWENTSSSMYINGCTEIPSTLRGKTFDIQLEENYCLEVYENNNCTGISTQVRKEIAGDHDPKYFEAESISLCGYNCLQMTTVKDNATNSDGISVTLDAIAPEKEIVTLFPQSNFDDKYGYRHVNLKVGCVNLSEELHTSIESIYTHGQCVEIYEEVDCRKQGKYFQLRDNEKLNSEKSKIPKRSIEFCQTVNLDIIHVVVVVALLMVVVILITSVIIITKCCKKSRILFSAREIEEIAHNAGNPLDKTHEISKNSIFVDKNSVLSSSEFGVVFKGKAKDSIMPKECEADVATKALQPITEVTPDVIEYLKEMLVETKLMIEVGEHRSVLRFIGCCTKQLRRGELLIITELCIHGPLDEFLQANCKSFKNREINLNSDSASVSSLCNNGETDTTINIDNACPFGKQLNATQLLKWSLEVAEGMEYLATKNVIHSDLTTSNVLLNSKFCTKICGFGISKQTYALKQCVKNGQGPASWRSMAIETLRDLEFSIESDIWAYGVVLWEIFSLGDVPYSEKEWGVSFLTELSNGMRLPQPKYASSAIYNLMQKCWCEVPSERSSFLLSKAELKTLLLRISYSSELKDYLR